MELNSIGNDSSSEVTDVTQAVIGCAFRVSNVLGCGFLEKGYENALVHELSKCGLACNAQVPIRVWYDNVPVGDYTADNVVANQVLVELKAIDALAEVHAAQCLNYLRATRLPVCLLFKFGRPKMEVRRLNNHLEEKYSELKP